MDQKIRKISLIRGLILGGLTVILSVTTFYFATQPDVTPSAFVIAPIILGMFIPMIVVILLCFNIRKSVGGLWTFKQAATGVFIMLITAYVINVLGKDLLFDKVIEPQGVVKMQSAAIAAKTASMKSKGWSQAKIDTSIGDLQKDLNQKGNSNIGSVIMGNAITIIFLFVLALIFASLMRNAVLVKAGSES
jgi:hypothetical protein